MAKPGSDQDGAMVEKTNGKKSKEKISPFVKTPKTEILGKEGRCKTLKRKLSFTVSPPRNEERGSDTDDTDPGQSSHAWGERLHTPCRIYADKDGPDKKKMKKEAGPKKSTPVNILFGYPLSERKQMALLMQMTARDNSPDSTPSHPSQASAGQKKITSSSSSRQKDKVNKRNERGETPLHLAAIRGDVKHVKELIGLGADVNIKDFAGWTPLHEACNLGYYDVAKVLIGAGAEVNTQGLDDDTPLHDATSSGYKNIMKLLLRNGGNAFQANKRGERPVDVAESKDLEHLLKGEIPLSEVEESSSESEDPTSVNQSSGDENMEYSDTDKDSDNKSVTVKASSSMSGLDEYEFKDEEEEEDISKALNERNILRRDLRQKEKETERNQFTSKQGKQSDQYRRKPKKSKSSLIYRSSESSSDESEFQAEKSVDCHKADSRLKHENLNNMPGEQKEKNKQKKKIKSQSKNKENQGVQEGKEKSISTTTVSEMADKGSREEDSFKMSFSAKDETSVHLFHLSVVKPPKLNQSQTEKQATPLKQENTKTSVSVSDESCSVDGIKHSHYIESDYSTEGSSNRNSKHKQKSKHHLNELSDDGSSSPFKDGSLNTSIDRSESLVRKTDKEGKGVKKHKLNHKEKEKCRKDYEAKNMRSLQKEARKDRHRNLEFDREFWKENFFKSDEKEEAVNKREVSPVKEERKIKDKHSCTSSNSKERRTKSEWERDKSLKREKKDFFVKGKDWKGDAFDERTETPGSGSFLDSFSHHLVVKDEPDHKSITGSIVDQDQMSSEKIPQEKNEKQPSTRERESDKCEKKYADKDKKIKNENLTDKSEMPNYIDRWNEKEKLAGASELPVDKSHKDTDKLKGTSSLKKHEDGRKNKDKRPDREHSSDHREKDKTNAEKRAKILEKPSDSLKSERFKEKEREKDCDKRKKEKTKENITSSSTFSSLKLLLEEKKKYGSENSKTSYKLKDDLNKPVEKDRERRDREREPERLRDWRERERHKEKERDRSKIEINRDGKINKIKSSEVESKMKIATVLKDTRPKEKRLVNDDLMKTSFERMLSLKDQEFEQWHRKHLEKIKQKEKERLKQRPGLDCGKPKSKEKLKTGFSPSEHSIPKELMRSKSSETSDLQREKVVKEATSIRVLSLEGKNSKINTSSENSFTISPKIEKEKSGLISRSMSMISMMSSEDSCQAVALTPRPVEYDSDMNMDFSGFQPPSLQQSSISPSCHNKDGVTPPDTMLCSQTPLSSRPTSQSLRSILDEHSKMTAAETKQAEISQQICTEPLSNVDQMTAHLVGNAVIQPFVALSGSESPTGKKVLETLACQTQPSLQMQESCSKEVQPDNIIQAHSAMHLHSEEGKAVATLANQTTKDSSLESAASIPVNVCEPSSSQNWESHMDEQAATEDPELKKILLIEENLVDLTDTSRISLEGSSEETTSFRDDVEKLACAQEDNASGLFNESLVDALVDKHDLVNHPTLKTNISCCASPEKIQEELTVDKHSLAEECLNKTQGEEMNDMKDVSFDKSLTGTHTLLENSDQSEVAEEKFANSDIHVRDAEDVTNPLYNLQGELQNEVTSARSSPLSVTERDSDFSGTRSKVQLLEDEFYLQATHPRKRKMQRVSALAQANITALHITESTQESLAAIVDGLKLEEIEPYETERANPYYDYLHIRKKIEAKRKVLCNVIPQAPQYYDEYVTFNGSYLLDGNPLSKLCIPTITPPPSLPDALKEMFKQQELVRMKLRLQHSIEREKLIVSNEQEVLRVHYRAARTLANQTLPFSACTVLLDAEVYNMPTDVQSEDGKASVRDRFNARQFMSWLQDVDDKFDKLKTCLLMRQQHEAAALNAVQRLEWQLKLQELDPASYKATSIFEIPEFYIPLVEVNDDFDLTPI